MLGLSIRQPFANAVVSGRKKTEFRSWATPYRGDLLICAGRQIDKKAALSLRMGASECEPRGVALCVVTLTACREVIQFIDDEVALVYEWRLKNPRCVQPVEVSGRLGLFSVGDIRLRYGRSVESATQSGHHPAQTKASPKRGLLWREFGLNTSCRRKKSSPASLCSEAVALRAWARCRYQMSAPTIPPSFGAVALLPSRENCPLP
jgi:hypothetical protein